MILHRSSYNSADKQGRILTEFHGMNLTNAMDDEPEESHMDVFSKFAARLMALQYQF